MFVQRQREVATDPVGSECLHTVGACVGKSAGAQGSVLTLSSRLMNCPRIVPSAKLIISSESPIVPSTAQRTMLAIVSLMNPTQLADEREAYSMAARKCTELVLLIVVEVLNSLWACPLEQMR